MKVVRFKDRFQERAVFNYVEKLKRDGWVLYAVAIRSVPSERDPEGRKARVRIRMPYGE